MKRIKIPIQKNTFTETEFKPLKNFFINNSNIKDLENKFNVTFPASFISTIKKFNDSIPDKRVIYKIDSDKEIRIIDRYISYNTEDKNNVLDVYETFVDEYNIKNCIPFATTPFGDFFCFRKPSMEIVFFNHELGKATKIFNDFDEFLSNAKKKKQTETYMNKDISKLKEGIIDGLSTLKEYRKKYENPQAKEFFREIRLISTDISENSLDEVIPIFNKHYPDVVLTEEYKALVLKLSKTIYNQFYEKFLLNIAQTQQISTAESSKVFKRDSFLFTICFTYSALLTNNKHEVISIYDKFQDKLESFDRLGKWAAVGFLIWFATFIISTITLSITLYLSSFIFVIASCILLLIESLSYYFTRKNIRKTGDVLK